MRSASIITAVSLLLGVGDASAERVRLKEGAEINGRVLVEKADRIYVDVGYSVIEIPRTHIVEVVKEHYPDHTDASGRFGMVDVKAVEPVKTPVTLADIKAEPKLADLALVKQSRLSVVPVGKDEWKLLCKMCGVKP
ncbi:MAG: EVE domain-containing protein [Alphaproteobacteria bacterium]|nr:EVE domain-containing protein [Alphaproteobacteria bacterium]